MALGDLSDAERSIILTLLRQNNQNDSVDFSVPSIKHTLRYVYPLFIFLHAFIIIFGTAGNAAILVVIARGRLYRNPTFFFLCNLALSDILKAAIVLPITLANLLMENWIFGSFLCFGLPMMHSFPIHASILTYTMIAIDRYRLIVHPMKSRVPAGLCSIAAWVVAVCVVLPYAVYMEYVDLGSTVGPTFDGVGICWVRIERQIKDYIRAMFITLYCLPLAVIAFLYVKVSGELKVADGPGVTVRIEEVAQSSSESSYQSRVTWVGENDPLQRMDQDDVSNATSSHVRRYSTRRGRCPSEYDDVDDDMDMSKEKRTQKYMITMVILFALCWCPVNILTLVTHFVYEDEGNTGHFDVTYLTFTFFGFLSTCSNPVLFASWRMSDQTKSKLRGYFRFSNRARGNAALDRNAVFSRCGSSGCREGCNDACRRAKTTSCGLPEVTLNNDDTATRH